MAKTDWDGWRRKYVEGDDVVTLKFLSEQAGAPTYGSIRTRASRESWEEQRKRFRNNRDTLVANVPSVQAVAAQTQRIIDAAEMLTQHNQVAKLLISQGVQALRGRDPAKLSDKDALAFLKAGIEIQRLTEGLATERQAVTHDGGVEIKVTRRIIDAH